MGLRQDIDGRADTAVPAAFSRQYVALGYGCATRCAVSFGNFARCEIGACAHESARETCADGDTPTYEICVYVGEPTLRVCVNSQNMPSENVSHSVQTIKVSHILSLTFSSTVSTL